MYSSHSAARVGSFRRGFLALCALLLPTALVIGVGNAGAADVTSAGPLIKITTTPDLNCAVNYLGDAEGSWYDDLACGTFVTDGTHVYGPADVPAGSSTEDIAWTPVSQTGPTGTGTAGDPFKLVTKVTGGPFTVVQTDTYIEGQEAYKTDVNVSSSSAVNAIVYRAGDCYLQDDDDGRGRLTAGIAPTCLASATATAPNRIEQFYPLTPGSRYMVSGYSTVWQTIADKLPFPNTVRSGDAGEFDNGLGLSWGVTLAAGASATFSHLTVFSPTGVQPLTVSKTASVSRVEPGGVVDYTITITNSGTASAPLSSITDALPEGFTYVAGSTTGATTDDPMISGQDLSWDGSFNVPAASGGAPGTVSLTFSTTASNVPGVYTNSASAVASQGAIVIGADNVAPVEVTGEQPTTTPPATVPPTTVPPTTPGTIPVTPAQPARPIVQQPTYTG